MPKHNSNCILDTINLLARALSHRNDDQEEVRLHFNSAAHGRLIMSNMKKIFPGILLFADTATSVTVNYRGTGLEKQWACSSLQISIGLIEILSNYLDGRKSNLFSRFSLQDIVSCVHTMLSTSSYDDYIDLVKYSTTWMHAKSLEQPTLPQKPSFVKSNAFPLLFRKNSHLHTWLCGLINASKNNTTRHKDLDEIQHMFWSIAQVKRCAAVVPDEYIEKSLIKHRLAMSKKPILVPSLLKDSLVSKWRSIVSGMTFNKYKEVHEFSSSASYESPMGSGGGKGEILYHMVKSGYTTNDDLLKMSYLPTIGVTERRGFSRISISDLTNEVFHFSDEYVVTPIYKEDQSGDPIGEKFNVLRRDYHSDHLGCSAKVHPICEPMKIRNITKGNSLTYAIAKGLQLDIHGYMRKLPQFSLIGKPLDINDISWLVKKSPVGLFASGDFSAATDNISIEMTKAFFEVILDKLILDHKYRGDYLTPEYVQTVRNALYEHTIEYPKSVGDSKYPIDLKPVLQSNGQLMGSVLSFVILCAINLCTYWHAVCPEIPDKKYKSLPVKVNGDDILFRTDISRYNNWLATIPLVGLEPSPGKNFISSNYCTVNSQLFSVRKGSVKYIPFFNVGMLLGQSKVARQELKSKPVYLLHKEVMEGAWSPNLADARFKYYNREKLIAASVHRNGCQLNWYIPNRLGGLGMSLPETTFVSAARAAEIGESIEHLSPYQVATDFQSKLAYSLHKKWTTPYKTAPMKQFGQQTQDEVEGKYFKNSIERNPSFVCIPSQCPPDRYLNEKVSGISPPNWNMCQVAFSPDIDTQFFYKPMSYRLKDVDQRRRCTNLSVLSNIELKEYEYNGSFESFTPIF